MEVNIEAIVIRRESDCLKVCHPKLCIVRPTSDTLACGIDWDFGHPEGAVWNLGRLLPLPSLSLLPSASHSILLPMPESSPMRLNARLRRRCRLQRRAVRSSILKMPAATCSSSRTARLAAACRTSFGGTPTRCGSRTAARSSAGASRLLRNRPGQPQRIRFVSAHVTPHQVHHLRQRRRDRIGLAGRQRRRAICRQFRLR